MIQSDSPAAEVRTARQLPRAFWLLWSAFVSSNLADGLLAVALPVLMLRQTDSPAAVAGLAAALSLPWLLVALPVGVLVDRVDRRRALLLANAARVLCLGGLAVAVFTDVATPVVLYGVAVALGCAEVVYDTAAQTMLPRLVSAGLLERANGRLFAGEVVANRFVGPPIGGVLVAASALAAVAAPAAAWLLASAALFGLRGSFRAERPEPSTVRAELAAGLRYLWGNSTVRTLTAVVGVVNLAISAALAVLVLFVVGDESVLGLREARYGLLLGALAVGAVAGSLGAARVVNTLGRGAAMTAGVATIIAMLVILATTNSAWLVAVGLLVSGAGSAVFSVTALSLRQQIVPDHLQGRVTAGYRLVAWGSAPVGALAAGIVGEVAGVRAVFWSAAILCAAAGLVTPLLGQPTPPSSAAPPPGDSLDS